MLGVRRLNRNGWRGNAFFVVCAVMALIAGSSQAGSTGSFQPTATARLTGHVLPILNRATRLDSVPPNQRVDLTIALRPASLDDLHAAAENPRGPNSAVGLAPDAFGQRFGQPQANIDEVVSYFRGYGLTLTEQKPDRLSVHLAGTAQQVGAALSVSLDNYQDSSGRLFFAANQDPSVPTSIAPYIQAIFGLDNYPAFRHAPLRVQATPGAYIPSDMRTAYDVTPLLNQGLDGTGQTIAVLGFNSFNQSDLNAFDVQFGLPQNTVTVINVDGGTTDLTSPETTLDLEWSHAIAPGAAQRFYGFPTGSINQVLDGLTQATNDNVASVINISLGGCENLTGSLFIQAFENEFASAAAKGIGVFVASGDQGAYTCGDGEPTPDFPNPTVSYPASSAFVTAAGGTSLLTTVSGNYGSESAWGTNPGECSPPCGSGGGVSSFVAEPSWQTQAGIPATGGFRALPDVSWNADPATGNVIFYTGQGDSDCSSGSCFGTGGTSIASPQWSGVAAIADQKAGRRLGQLAPLLYGSNVLNARSGSSSPYHDVTTGNNLFYNATTGWDFATGWGSPDVNNLVNLLVPPPATPTPTVTLTPTNTPCPTATPTLSPTPSKTPQPTPVDRVFVPVVFSSAKSGC
jgi:kumamolisin